MKTLKSYFWGALVGLAVLLSGCATTGANTKLKDIPEVQRADRTPPAEAMVACAKAKGLEDETFGAVVRKLSEVIGLLDECAGKQDELRKYLESKPQK